MRLRVLGCHGGETDSHRATSFLIDDTLLLDAGAVTRGLDLQAQCRIDHVFITHSHLDHVRDLALLVDNIIGERPSPLMVYCTDPTADALHNHIFNDIIWPDFTKIINPSDPQQRPPIIIKRVKSGETFRAGNHLLRTCAVNHPVDCQAVFVTDVATDPAKTLVYSGDTGRTEALWVELNRLPNISAFIYEVSFPNEYSWLADVSGHLTPEIMAEELRKFRPKSPVPILLYHLKPGYYERVKQQIEALSYPGLRILEPLDEYEF